LINDSISQHVLEYLYDTSTKKTKAVLKAKAGHTPYCILDIDRLLSISVILSAACGYNMEMRAFHFRSIVNTPVTQ